MIQFKRIDHFHVCVPPERLEEAREFYSRTLGLQQIERPDHLFSSAGYWFDIGDAQLHIGVEVPMEQSIRHTALEVSDLAAARAHLYENGVQIIEEPVIPAGQDLLFLTRLVTGWSCCRSHRTTCSCAFSLQLKNLLYDLLFISTISSDLRVRAPQAQIWVNAQ